MNLNSVKGFRHAVYGCLQRAGLAPFSELRPKFWWVLLV